MKNDIFKFPNGGGTKIGTMTTVNITDTGVMVLNVRGDTLGWIEVADPDLKKAVSEEILDAISAGKRFVQPDWSFLTEGVED